jgi:hypothetical protein
MHLNGGYPIEIADFDPDDFGLGLNNVVWDIMRGNILKIAEDKFVVRGFHGLKPLTEDQIYNFYGSRPKFSALNYPM